MAQSIPSSAAEIVAAIRAKKITATAVAKAAFERAEQLKDLNALHFPEQGRRPGNGGGDR